MARLFRARPSVGGRTAVGAAAAVWAGMLLGARAGAPAAVLVPLAALAITAGFALQLAGAARRVPSRFTEIMPLTALLLAGMARAAAHHAALAHERESIQGAFYRIEGSVVDPPLRESGAPSATLAVESAAPPLARGTRVRLVLPPGSSAEWGDRVTALVRLDPPGPVRNPGGIDPAASADAGALAAWGRAFTATVLDSSGVPRATSARWRRALEAAYAARLTPEARELVVPLVIGDRSALSSELDAAFRAAGVVHLLALSGLHVTWMAGVARGVCAALGLGTRARAVGGALCALLYGALAGPLPSLARAVGTELFGAAAKLAHRPLDPVQALALSALAGLVVAPGWAEDLGFQLSCVATLGLVTVGAALAARAGRWRRLLQPFTPTASAQLTALPLLLARLHVVSWVAPAANLLAVPISELLLAAAWLAGVWEIVLPGSARFAFASCEALAEALRFVTESSAHLPGAAWATGAEPLVSVIAACGAVLVALGVTPPRTLVARHAPDAPWRAASTVIGAACIVAALAAAAFGHALLPAPGRAWLVTLDVGQGDALGVATPGGWWLIDAGPRTPHVDQGERAVLPFLRWAGVRELQAVVLTHDDADHTGGAAAVLRAVAVGRRLAPPPRADAPGPGARYRAQVVARGDTLLREPCLRVLWPPPDIRFARGLSDNRTAVVLELACDSTRALLLADVDSTAERLLEPGPVAVLKVAHHGSRTSTSPGLLAATRPRIAVISCGRWNHFGHPHPEVLERLRSAGVPYLRTDRDGAIWIELDASGARVLDWRHDAAALRSEAAGEPKSHPEVTGRPRD